MDLKLARKMHIGQLNIAGDYCFDSTGRVIMACPVCAKVFLCPHTVEQAEPLTLSPSVVGPDDIGVRADTDQILAIPCLHHFWVKNGIALEIS